MHTRTHDRRFGDVVDPAAEVSTLADGFVFTEGPVWHPYEKTLIFSDVAGDRMLRWTPADGISTFRNPSNMANGNAYDRAGRLVTCEHATSRVVRTDGDGTVTTLASHYEGTEFNSPNDIVVHSAGGIYFSDPDFGRREFFGVPRPKEMAVNGVYLIRGDGVVERVADDFAQPNGLCFSVDERRLFVNDSPRRHIRVFDVRADGSLTGGAVWAELGGDGAERTPDGMKIDAAGNLFCVGPEGIHVFAPDGVRIGVILVPQGVANFAWGDDDLCGLYITAVSTLYHCRLKVPGLPQFV